MLHGLWEALALEVTAGTMAPGIMAWFCDLSSGALAGVLPASISGSWPYRTTDSGYRTSHTTYHYSKQQRARHTATTLSRSLSDSTDPTDSTSACHYHAHREARGFTNRCDGRYQALLVSLPSGRLPSSDFHQSGITLAVYCEVRLS